MTSQEEAMTRGLSRLSVQLNFLRKWCPEPELNQRHADFQPFQAALNKLGNFKQSHYDSMRW
jgi:hypothetical protein